MRAVQGLGLLLALTGCSQRVQVTSEPPGAEIFLNGRATGLKTPAELLVHRKSDTQSLEFHLPGYGVATTCVEERGRCPCILPFGCCWWGLSGDGDGPPKGSARAQVADTMDHLARTFSGTRIPKRVHVRLTPVKLP